MQRDVQGLEAWVAWLGEVDIPVLGQTARDLARLREDPKRLDARNVSQIVARDPLMSVKLLRRFQHDRRKSEFPEFTQIERVVIMMGLEAFFDRVPTQPLVENVLRTNLDALTMLLRSVRRSHRASKYAGDWAVMLHDLHFDEIRTAACLYDFADQLLWCFAPVRMIAMRNAHRADRSLRSKDAQEAVFGFAFVDLQTALARQWGLPPLLLEAMANACSLQARLQNVILAVNVTRHSARGWDDAALPDDYEEIAHLLRIPASQVADLVGAPLDLPLPADEAQAPVDGGTTGTTGAPGAPGATGAPPGPRPGGCTGSHAPAAPESAAHGAAVRRAAAAALALKPPMAA